MKNKHNKFFSLGKWLPGLKAKIGIGIIVLFVIIAIFGPLLAPYPINDINFDSWLSPSATHWLGTDSYGQDVLSQLIYGTRESLLVGVLAGLIATVIGVIVGLIAGYRRGWIDEGLMRFVDLLLVIPTLALMIILAAFLPSMGPTGIILVIGCLSWLYMARSVRSQTLSESKSVYVESAKVSGASHMEIMFREIMPNVVPVIMANLVLVITQAILAEAGLDFLGVGDPNSVSWGTILSLANSNNAVMYNAWWWLFPPGIAIALLCTGFVLIGNSILEKYQQNHGNAAV